MNTETIVAQMALDHIGGEQIEALAPIERSNNAQRCARWIGHARRETLEAVDWTFARRRKVLALDSFDPPSNWSFRYQYPADCLKARRVFNPLGLSYPPIPFEKLVADTDDSAQGILCNVQDAELVYTFDQKNLDTWPSSAITLYSWCLAKYIAMPVMRKPKIKQWCEQQFNFSMATLPGQDANEDQQDKDQQPLADWHRVRN